MPKPLAFSNMNWGRRKPIPNTGRYRPVYSRTIVIVVAIVAGMIGDKLNVWGKLSNMAGLGNFE